MKKQNKKVYKKGVQIKLPISKHIEKNFRNYALYVLENRGIPSWADGLTNVQRFLLKNAPKQYSKTLSLVGSCFNDSYAHGDSSLHSAITKLARPYNSGMQLLEGDGFFGNAISNEAAAPRYTNIRINSTAANLIEENHFLHTKHENGYWNPFYLKIPLGLVTNILGIAVGYSTTILPRKLEDIEKYFNGKLKKVKPYFINFNGKISEFKKIDSNKKSWLIEGCIDIDELQQTIKITEIPPLVKYESFIKKLDKLVHDYHDIKLYNNSQSNINIKLDYRGKSEKIFEEIVERVKKITKIIVTENIVFIKDSTVLVYDKIEDYLEDYKYRIAELNYKQSEYYLNINTNELEYQEGKLKFLNFMSEKKRTSNEIDIFLKNFKGVIAARLDKIILRKLNKNEIELTKKEIQKLKTEIKNLKKQTNQHKKEFNNLTDPTIKRGLKNVHSNAINLFDDSDFDDYEGIEIFKLDEGSEDVEESENN